MSEHLPRRLQKWWDLAQAAGHLHGVDACLILAIIDRESLGGEALRPRGEAGVGDAGNGLGLMQIDKRHHREFCSETMVDGSPAWANAWRNIDYGTRFLRGLLEHFTRRPYLEMCAVAAYNADVHAVDAALMELTEPATEFHQLRAVDSVTTGKNYASDVLARRDRFRRLMSLPTS